MSCMLLWGLGVHRSLVFGLSMGLSRYIWAAPIRMEVGSSSNPWGTLRSVHLCLSRADNFRLPLHLSMEELRDWIWAAVRVKGRGASCDRIVERRTGHCLNKRKQQIGGERPGGFFYGGLIEMLNCKGTSALWSRDPFDERLRKPVIHCGCVRE